MVKAIAILAAGFLTAFPAASQDLKPLRDTISSSGPVYTATRCAALYMAIGQWVGPERMGDESWQKVTSTWSWFLEAAVHAGQPDSGSTIKNYTDIVVRDAFNIVSLYQSRMEQNYAATGQGFGEDSLIDSDLDLCKFLIEK